MYVWNTDWSHVCYCGKPQHHSTLTLLHQHIKGIFVITKGQLISECVFDNLKFSKKTTKNLTNFCPTYIEYKKWSYQQNIL